MYSVVIVDNHKLLSQGIASLVDSFDDFNVEFTCCNGRELLTRLKTIQTYPDIVLMDINMPVLNGIETTEIVKQKYPHIKIIMLTVFDNDENIFNAIKAGADGYLLKEINAKDLHDGIIETLNGGAAMNPSIAMKTLKLLRNPIEIENQQEKEDIKLTERETDVLEQLSKGLSYQAIAENLILSHGTIRKHIENTYRKLQVHNKLEAVQKAKRNNLI